MPIRRFGPLVDSSTERIVPVCHLSSVLPNHQNPSRGIVVYSRLSLSGAQWWFGTATRLDVARRAAKRMYIGRQIGQRRLWRPSLQPRNSYQSRYHMYMEFRIKNRWWPFQCVVKLQCCGQHIGIEAGNSLTDESAVAVFNDLNPRFSMPLVLISSGSSLQPAKAQSSTSKIHREPWMAWH